MKTRENMMKIRIKGSFVSPSASRVTPFLPGELIDVIRILPNGDALVWGQVSPSMRSSGGRRRIAIPELYYDIVSQK